MQDLNRLRFAILGFAFCFSPTMTFAMNGGGDGFCLPNQTLQQYPLRLIVPFGPGGSADGVARVLAKALRNRLNTQVVVENKLGAQGTLAADFVVRSGNCSILVSTPAIVTAAPSLFSKLSYDPLRDLRPLALVGIETYVLVVHPALSTRSVSALVALARNKPGTLTAASAGNGSFGHLAIMMFTQATGSQVVHVPFKGTGPAVIDLIGGNISLGFFSLSSVVAHIKSGRLVGIAVIGRTRASSIPDVPTLAEAGAPGLGIENWLGLLGPSGIRESDAEKANVHINEALKAKDVREQFDKLGISPVSMTVDEFGALIRKEIETYARLLRDAGYKPQ